MPSLADIQPKDCIDLCFGEATIVRQALFKHFSFPDVRFEEDSFISCQKYGNIVATSNHAFNYPHPSGYKPLREFLEQKHQTCVIITNGAKQALGAMFYALKKLGHNTLGHHDPIWGLIKPLAEAHGLQCSSGKHDCFLSIMPNNPDGATYDLEYGKNLHSLCQERKIPFIHDAAYYTPVYLDDKYEYGKIGDAQIYSISKMFGLSNLRLGYIVFHDLLYYKYVQEYMEMMTVGVPTITQVFLYELLQDIARNPELERQFIVDARDALYQAKFLCRTIRKDIIQVPENVENQVGMFLWAKLLKKGAFEKANILVSNGTPDYVRINLAVTRDKLISAIERLNVV